MFFVVGLVVFVHPFGLSAFRTAEFLRAASGNHQVATSQARAHPMRRSVPNAEVHIFQELGGQRVGSSFSAVGLLFWIEANGLRVSIEFFRQEIQIAILDRPGLLWNGEALQYSARGIAETFPGD